jgi:hypothetical protein
MTIVLAWICTVPYQDLYSSLPGFVQSLTRICTVPYQDLYSHLPGFVQSLTRICTVPYQDLYSPLPGFVQSLTRIWTVPYQDLYSPFPGFVQFLTRIFNPRWSLNAVKFPATYISQVRNGSYKFSRTLNLARGLARRWPKSRPIQKVSSTKLSLTVSQSRPSPKEYTL